MTLLFMRTVASARAILRADGRAGHGLGRARRSSRRRHRVVVFPLA